MPYLPIELFHIGMPVVRTHGRAFGRSVGRSVGVRSRDYQIFSDGQLTTFFYPWCSATRARAPLLMAGTEYFGQTAVQLHTGQHYAEITQSHPFVALIRLSTTTHNFLTFNISEILSNNSEKLSLLPDKDLWTFLLHSSYSSSRM